MKIVTIGQLNMEKDEGDEVIKSSFNRFNFKDDSIDMVVCTNLPELKKKDVIPFVQKVRAVLKKGGLVVVQVPNAEYACKKMFLNESTPEILFMLYGTDVYPHYACYTMKMLRLLFEAQGFITYSATDDIIRMSSGEDSVQIPVHTLRVRKA
jgi:predicted SAM-dependent methyltransferase